MTRTNPDAPLAAPRTPPASPGTATSPDGGAAAASLPVDSSAGAVSRTARRRLLDRPSATTWIVLGFVGSIMAAAGSYWMPTTPLYFRTDPPPVVDLMTPQAPPARVLWYLGLALLAFAWLRLGHRLWTGATVSWRALRVGGLWWSLPWLFAVPASSRDLWSYAAQAKIADAGLDPYRVAPATFGGPFAANVSAHWVDTSSPYGPLWTLIGRGLVVVAGDRQLTAVLLLRLPAAAGLLLLAFAIPALARRFGGSPVVATWLVVASPLMVIHGVGGGHNDVLMMGLVAAGLWLAVSRRGWWVLPLAGAVIALGAAVKLPAIVAVPFLPLLAARFGPGASAPGRFTGWGSLVRERGRAVLTGLAAAAVGAVAVLAGCTVAAGHGLEWIGAANTSSHGGGPVVIALLVLALVACWMAALRYGNAVLLLALALLAVTLVSRYALAWYWFWPLVVAAPVLRGRPATFIAAVIALYELFWVLPSGQDLPARPELVWTLAIATCWLLLDHRWRPFSLTKAHRQPDSETVAPPPASSADI